MMRVSEEQREQFNKARKLLVEKYGTKFKMVNLFTKDELIDNINSFDWEWVINDEIEQAEVHLEKITHEQAKQRAKKYFMEYDEDYIFNYKISDSTKVQMIINKVLGN